MLDRGYPLKAFAVMAAATFACRLFPFLVPRKWQTNRHLRFIGDSLPAAVMLLLVVYCLKGEGFGAPPYGIPALISVAAVIAVHLWRRNALLSIGTGTGLYMFFLRTGLLQRFFVQ